MSSSTSGYATRIVGLLVVVEAASVFLLWTINAVGQTDEGLFAIYLAIALVSLAMISNVYRSYMSGRNLDRVFLLAGCVLILIFIFSGLAL